MLVEIITTALRCLDESTNFRRGVSDLASMHVKSGLFSGHFDLYTESILKAIRRCLGSACDTRTRSAWEKTIRNIMNLMKPIVYRYEILQKISSCLFSPINYVKSFRPDESLMHEAHTFQIRETKPTMTQEMKILHFSASRGSSYQDLPIFSKSPNSTRKTAFANCDSISKAFQTAGEHRAVYASRNKSIGPSKHCWGVDEFDQKITSLSFSRSRFPCLSPDNNCNKISPVQSFDNLEAVAVSVVT